ncbi:hypothetical protein BpHYR1_007602 [Brachionus plicatilis]|uniref:Uncharacterized protein n=1 Tax=Brachionus plicatilis TaxID=10195 RepID=A0A3M7R185_BRAPC|nr:hypothetical protein BpHYR1_007602 [Brachionus plicatilis]
MPKVVKLNEVSVSKTYDLTLFQDLGAKSNHTASCQIKYFQNIILRFYSSSFKICCTSLVTIPLKLH